MIGRFSMKTYKIMSNVTIVYSPRLQQSFASLSLYKQHLSPQEFNLEECITNVEQIKLALRCYLVVSHFFLRFLLTTGMQPTSGQSREAAFTVKY